MLNCPTYTLGGDGDVSAGLELVRLAPLSGLPGQPDGAIRAGKAGRNFNPGVLDLKMQVYVELLRETEFF